MISSLTRLAGAFAVLIALSGCSVFYSEARDKQGQAASAAWQKVEVATQISLARKNHAALLADQLKATDELAAAQRTLAARQLAIGSESVRTLLLGPINSELAILSPSESEVTAWLDFEQRSQSSEAKLATITQNFRQRGFLPKVCGDVDKNEADIAAITNIDATRGAELNELQTSYRLACVEANGLGSAPKLTSGSLADVQNDAINAKAAVDTAKKDTAPAREAFEAALKSYNAASSQQEANAKGLTNQLEVAKSNLQKVVEGADKAQKVLNSALGTKLLADAEQDSIDRFLATFSAEGGKAPSTGVSHSAAAVLALSKFAGEAKAEWANTDKPNLVPLLLARNLAQAKSDAATREIQIRTLSLSLRQQRVQILTQRYTQLSYARNALMGQPEIRRNGVVIRQATGPVTLDESAVAAFTPVGPAPGEKKKLAVWMQDVNNKQRTWDAATNYLDDVGRLQPAASKPLFQIDALAHDRALSLAESNLDLWTSIINSVVGQSAAFASSGIKPADIQALINSASLLWIGRGVN